MDSLYLQPVIAIPPLAGEATARMAKPASRQTGLPRGRQACLPAGRLVDALPSGGSVRKDAIKSLAEYNIGKNRFTKGHFPWKIIYTESHPDWAAAQQKEKNLKTNAEKIWLRKRFANE